MHIQATYVPLLGPSASWAARQVKSSSTPTDGALLTAGLADVPSRNSGQEWVRISTDPGFLPNASGAVGHACHGWARNMAPPFLETSADLITRCYKSTYYTPTGVGPSPWHPACISYCIPGPNCRVPGIPMHDSKGAGSHRTLSGSRDAAVEL